MNTKDFVIGEYAVTVRRYNPRGGDMDRALYVRALTKVYPEMKTGPDEQDIASLTRIGSAWEFARLATQVVRIVGLPFDWPKPTDDPTLIDAAYKHYLYEAEELYDAIKDECAALDNPNGVSGGPAGALTADQLASPLLSSKGRVTPKESAAD